MTMNRMMKKILSMAAVLVLTSFVGIRAQELVSTTLTKDTILIGDQVEWKSVLKVPKGLRASIDSMSGYVVPGVELIGDFRIDTVKRHKAYSDVEAKGIITSFDSGSYKLPPLVVYFTRGDEIVDTLRLKEMDLEVTTIPIDTATYEMYDIRPQFNYPVTFAEVAPWAGGGLLLVAIIVAIVYYFRRRAAGKPVFAPAKPKDPAHIVALRKLEEIRNEKLWQEGKEKQFYTEVTDTLRAYIEDRFDIKTFERTSAEILEDISKKDLTPADYEILKDIFSTSDLVKFAKYTASQDENENAIPASVRFVNDTFLQAIEDEKNKEGGK